MSRLKRRVLNTRELDRVTEAERFTATAVVRGLVPLPQPEGKP
jgi:hypothetical protein